MRTVKQPAEKDGKPTRVRLFRRPWHASAFIVLAVVLGVTAGGCEDDNPSESKTQKDNYSKLTKRQPAETMDYSPTRETINAWIRTWEKPGKLAYVYVQNGNGQYGYYVMKGLPVSYCAMLTPNYEIKDRRNSDVVVPAPGMDGVYYSGGQCNVYYGIDATTGAYQEFSLGMNQSYFLYSEPQTLPQYRDAQQMGPTSIEDAKKD